MNKPPMLMHLRFQNEDGKFGLWLPLALVVLIILSPLILITILVLWPSGWGRRALLAIKDAFVLFCSLRGLKVDIQSRNQFVYVSVI